MSDIEIYKSPDNKIELQVNLEKDTVWLSQKQMAELFDKDPDTIGLHLKNIYGEEELMEKSTTGVFPVVQKEEFFHRTNDREKLNPKIYIINSDNEAY